MGNWIASIPSPSDGVLHLGPIDIHAYGLMIALGVVAGAWLSGRRLEAASLGTRDDMHSIALWGVLAGVIGARIYFIITDASRPWKTPSRWPKVWEGGLGVPGGILAGTLVAGWAIRRRGLSVAGVYTAAAPAIPLSQAIGRIGNWWNQELFGRPTTLPWALRIDDAHLPAGYVSGTTFHPTFLYEVIWNLALCGVLLLIDRRIKLRPGRLLAVYVVGYSIGRFWIEGLRIDPAHSGGGWRLNQWMAVIACALAAGYLLIDFLRHSSEPRRVTQLRGRTNPVTTNPVTTHPVIEVVLYEVREPGIAVITLNRPDRLNAWTGELAVRYFALLDQAASDPGVKVVVITGAGRGFCSGADMDALQVVNDRPDGASVSADRRGPHEMTLIPKPIIAAVNGAAAGIGLVIALMCDVRFAATTAKFTTAFSRRGLVAEYGISWILPRLVGTANAFDLLYSGRVILGDEAMRMGMVNEVMAPELVLDRAIAYATELATLASPTSMAVMKRQLYADWNRSLPDATETARELMEASFGRDDLKEGIASYMQKRSPNFGAIDPSA